ncbi:ankyrin repeat domain-containing protein 50 isoform X2 [Sitodiplosis mosellana]|uniref:ankyrin repeat domain-containing protein 50 isoform X2 n=1 Tax=Sitodiplosis mosellana TaxID=263140 RepID=UPI0024439BAE|nr:ankyrin repeat domain-containing protein 50 isoform X2 [Sitodiplosis mosellana]
MSTQTPEKSAVLTATAPAPPQKDIGADVIENNIESIEHMKTEMEKLKIDEQQTQLIDLSVNNQKTNADNHNNLNTKLDTTKEMIYATPLRKLDRPKVKASTNHDPKPNNRDEMTNGTTTTAVNTTEDRHILNFLKDTSKLQKKLQRSGCGSGNNSSGDSDYGKENFSSLAQEQHFVNLVQQNVIGYSENATHETDSTNNDDETAPKGDAPFSVDGVPDLVPVNGTSEYLPKISEVFIKREWIIKLIALSLEQRLSKQTKLTSMALGDEAVGESRKKSTSSRMQQKATTQQTGVFILGSNGSGKTSICKRIVNGTTGTQDDGDSANQSKNSDDISSETSTTAFDTTLMDTTSLVQPNEEAKNTSTSSQANTNEHIENSEEKSAKTQMLRQNSEANKSGAKSSNRDSTYDTYPPSQKTNDPKASEQNPCYTPTKSKTSRGSSKIPVKIGNKSGSPSISNTKETPNTSPAKKSTENKLIIQTSEKNEPNKEPDIEIEYENVEIRKKSDEPKTDEKSEERKVDKEIENDHPQPPPKTKSCLQTIADEYFAILTQNPEIMDSLNADNIEKNPDECFKKAILYPFLELQPPKSALLFLVDSIDEHYLNEEENVMSTLKGSTLNRSRTIVELLANNFHLMPKWLFLVCTAKRQNKHIVKRFNGFKKIALDDLRKSHVVKDVQEYIIARLNADFKGQIQFSADIIDCLNQLYIKSNGSILYLEKVLSGIRENVFSFREIKLIPCTLNGLYLYICQKSFNKKQYTKIRPILNILLACSDFVELTFVLNCLRTHNYTIDEPEFDKRIDAMKYVLTFNDDRTKVKIFHNSFSDWLSDVKFSTKKFLCSVTEGHAMISMYYTLVSDTLCPNQVLRYFGHLIKCDEYAKGKNINLDLILILLESKANLVDCFYINALNCCAACELDYKQTYCMIPRMRTTIERFLNKALCDDVLDFIGDFFKPSLPTNTKILKLLIETGINNADCQFSYDSLITSPVTEDNNDELAKLLINSEKSCQRNNNNNKDTADVDVNEYQEIVSPPMSPTNHKHNRGDNDECSNDLAHQHQLLSCGKALIHLLANEGNVAMLKRALNACKKDGNGLATIDLEVEDECGQTALNIAARNGHFEIVELLLSLRYVCTSTHQIKHVSVNHADRDGWTPLRSASWGGHTDIVKLLIKHPEIQIDLSDKEQRTALRAASWSGHEDILKALINAGADVNSVDRQGRTSLIAASYMGHYEIVEILLENGADVNHLDIDGRSALCVAALCGSSGYSRVISILLEYHANADQQDNDGMSSLLVSAFEGNAEVCELLLENGADPDLSDNMGRTPLWAACTKGHANIVKLLLFWGCSIDCMDQEGRTVLSIAAAQGNPESVRQLLDRGLDETHRDNAGWTALHYGAFEGYEDVCLQLIEAGAKIYECDNEGKNALHIAAQEGRTNVIEALVTATNVCIDQKAHDGKTAFRLACCEGNIECIDALIKYGCDVNLRDADGRPTLYILALENNVGVAKYLLEHSNININLPDNEGRTPLHVAAWQGHLEMVELLVAQGCADVNAMDLDFRTPLHSCAWQGNDRVMEMLLFYGASCDHACKQGATALGISAQEGHEKCVSILLQYGANPNKSDLCGRTPIKLALKSNNYSILKLLENALKNEGLKQQKQRNAAHKILQSPPEKKAPNGTVFYENTMRSDASSNNAKFNRKSVISSHSTGSSNNETTGASSSTNKNYQASQSSSKPAQQQQLPGNYRSSMSSHSDIFMKADEQKINFDLSDMGCMSPLYATPPISPSSDNGPNFEDQFETPTAIFAAHNAENNDHFARDTHMRIILGNNKEASQPSKKSLKRSGITTNPAVRLLRNRFDSAAQLIRRTNNMLSSSSSNNEGSSSIGVKSGTFQWRKESQM